MIPVNPADAINTTVMPMVLVRNMPNLTDLSFKLLLDTLAASSPEIANFLPVVQILASASSTSTPAVSVMGRNFTARQALQILVCLSSGTLASVVRGFMHNTELGRLQFELPDHVLSLVRSEIAANIETNLLALQNAEAAAAVTEEHSEEKAPENVAAHLTIHPPNPNL